MKGEDESLETTDVKTLCLWLLDRALPPHHRRDTKEPVTIKPERENVDAPGLFMVCGLHTSYSRVYREQGGPLPEAPLEAMVFSVSA